MPTIYDIDFNKQSHDQLPPQKRLPKYLAYFRAFIICLTILHDRFFNKYADGFTGLKWSTATAYVKGNTIRYNNSVFECIVAHTNHSPYDIVYWVKILDNFIGVRERVKFNGQKIVLEYALNRIFDVPASDPQIYITNNEISGNTFLLGETGTTSSSMAADSNFSMAFLSESYAIQNYTFTIFVPVLVYGIIDTNPVNAEKIVRQVADKYVIAGMMYNVLTY